MTESVHIVLPLCGRIRWNCGNTLASPGQALFGQEKGPALFSVEPLLRASRVSVSPALHFSPLETSRCAWTGSPWRCSESVVLVAPQPCVRSDLWARGPSTFEPPGSEQGHTV